jgi:hypothetical protein
MSSSIAFQAGRIVFRPGIAFRRAHRVRAGRIVFGPGEWPP